MTDLVFRGQNDQAVTTSLKVAEVFEKEHQHILRDIRSLIEGMSDFGETPMFEETTSAVHRPRIFSCHRAALYEERRGMYQLQDSRLSERCGFYKENGGKPIKFTIFAEK